MSRATLANERTDMEGAPLYLYCVRRGRCIDCGTRIAGTINARCCGKCMGKRRRKVRVL